MENTVKFHILGSHKANNSNHPFCKNYALVKILSRMKTQYKIFSEICPKVEDINYGVYVSNFKITAIGEI
jgi:hypothetical protein